MYEVFNAVIAVAIVAALFYGMKLFKSREPLPPSDEPGVEKWEENLRGD